MGLNKITRCLPLVLLLSLFSHHLPSQIFPRTIHVYVALCDNEHQRIVPVPPELGNGEDPKNNLFWGALYGVKTQFKKSKDWRLVASIQSPKYEVLERCVFKHSAHEVFLIADAYRGNNIKRTLVDFLDSVSGNKEESLVVKIDSRAVNLNIGGKAQLIVYVGHNGLMNFNLEYNLLNKDRRTREAIVLACKSKSYFKEPLQKAGAHPLLWTTGLLTAEAYTLKGAIDGWVLKESGEKIRERAAQAYDRYQKCGLKAAKRLLVTGW